jgi:RNA polymerase sigma factor (sigma-70 family)
LDEYTDKELVRLFREGSNPGYAFNLVVRKYQEKLYWHIRKMLISHEDTDDTLQVVFIKAYESLPRFREESSLYTWLYRIATNEALSFLKRKKLRRFLSMEDIGTYLERTLVSDAYSDGEEIQMKLQKAVIRLPEKQRIVFNMKYFGEMKYEDMADILKTSVGALKASYHHAIKKIENYLQED